MKKEPYKKGPHVWDKYEMVIVFDGVCKFCNAFVNFVIARDKKQKFKFGTLQSEPGQQILDELGFSKEDLKTIFFLHRGQVFTKSTAALKIAGKLDGLWPLLSVLLVIPRLIRDICYDYIARNRYKWLGKSETCRVPTAADRHRFV